MSNGTFTEAKEVEDGENEPMTVEELFQSFISDATNEESPEILADDIFSEFVEPNKPEAAQILTILDLPDEAMFQLIAQIQMQGMAKLVQAAPPYLAELRQIIARRLSERAVSKKTG